MSVGVTTRHDPAEYRRRSEPFASLEETTNVIAAFHDDLRALCMKHRIRDVHAVWAASHKSGEGEVEVIGDAHVGEPLKEVAMLSWALGRAEERVAADLTAIRRGARRAGA